MTEEINIEQLSNLLRNITISNQITMPDNKEKREFALQNLNFIEPFNGDSRALALFIGHIDSIVATIVGLESNERQLFFNAVQRKLSGQAADLLRRENPSDWRTLRTALIEEFGEKKDISTLILELGNIKFANSVKLFCDNLNNEICKIKDCIKLSEDSETRKNIYRSEVDKFSLEILRKGLPYHITALLNANPISDFKSALRILRESGSYLFEFKERKFKKSEKVDNVNYSQTQNRPFIPHFGGMTHNFYNPQCQTNIPHLFSSVQQNPNYSLGYANQFNPYNYGAPNGNNLPQQQHSNLNRQVMGIQKANNSNQSRIRRYGAPVPMEQDASNFHLHARENCLS